MENTCNCGQTEPVYYPDENQYEPGCWECYYNQKSSQTYIIVPDKDEDLPF